MNTVDAAARQRRRRSRRTRLTVTLLITSLILLATGYTSAIALTEIPAASVTVHSATTQTFAADPAVAQAVIDAQSLPSAIGWADGDEVWSNDDTAYSLGSIAKLITVLVCMEAKPLAPGSEGETYTWTAADAQLTEQYLALDGVAYRIPVGTELTQRDMLKFIFLPSANDYAHAYALWTFGSNEAFLEAVQAFKEKNGLTSLNFVEPTGMDSEDQANPADLVRVARLALANPTIREFNGMKTADMPWGVGTIENSNPLLGVMPGVIGTKTGTLFSVGYNFIVSQEADAEGRPITKIAVALARPSKYARADAGRELLDAMTPLHQRVEVVTEGEAIGVITTFDGTEIPLLTAGAADAILLPGEEAVRTTELFPLTDEVSSPMEESTGPDADQVPAGVIRIDTPTGQVEVPVVATGEVTEPDFWWRFKNPAKVFGW